MDSDFLKSGKQLDTLHKQADELLEKMTAINAAMDQLQKRFDDLPDVGEFLQAMPSAADLEKFAEAWDEHMPTINDLREYSNAIPDNRDIERFVEEWERLPSLDDVKKYAEAAARRTDAAE